MDSVFAAAEMALSDLVSCRKYHRRGDDLPLFCSHRHPQRHVNLWIHREPAIWFPARSARYLVNIGAALEFRSPDILAADPALSYRTDLCCFCRFRLAYPPAPPVAVP